uniref:HVA22-like protein n=1 Tax=Anthurium amnicola TaxID=1678845 RepID=A0A1D1Y1P6_9ARAE
MGFVGTIARHLDALVSPGVMLLYPLYASLRAIERPSPWDDRQWLTYWVLYSFITLFELSCYKALAWFPLWPYIKLLFCVWLVLPSFKGAAYIYQNLLMKYIKISGPASSSYSEEEERRVLQMMSADARKSVQRYIERLGPEAFHRVLQAAEMEAVRSASRKGPL